MKSVKKIVFVINTLGCGGAERVVVHLSKVFAHLGYETTVIVFSLENQYFTLDPKVKIINLKRKSPFHILSTCWKLRHAIHDCSPDAVITYMTNVTYHLLFSLFFFRPYPNIFATFHIHHSTCNTGIFRFINLSIFKNMMSRCAKLICCSKDMAEDICNLYSIDSKNVTTIYNPVDIDKCQKMSTEKIQHPFFENKKTPVLLAVGSLCYQKNYPMMLETIAKVNKTKQVKLIVLGDGPLREELKDLRDELKLNDAVDFVGNVKNPFAYMRKADLFILSSHFEGFPMVLLETMACKLPIVSVDCPSGPRELITNSETGVLVPPESSDELAKGICYALNNPDKMKKCADVAYEFVSNKFSVENIAKEYLKIIIKALDQKKLL